MITIDASVVFKWLKSKNEPYHKEALFLLQDHLSNRNRILAPNILFIEIANSLVTKTETTDITVQDDLDYLYKIDLQVVISDTEMIKETARLAKEYKTTVYDMLYAVIAQKHNTLLITADEKFIRKTKFPFVKLLSEYKS